MFGKITIVLNLMVKRERRFGATIRGAKVEIRITSKICKDTNRVNVKGVIL